MPPVYKHIAPLGLNEPTSNPVREKFRLVHLDADRDGLADAADVSLPLPGYNVVGGIAGQRVAVRKAEAGDGIAVRRHQVRRFLKEFYLYPTPRFAPVVEP